MLLVSRVFYFKDSKRYGAVVHCAYWWKKVINLSCYVQGGQPVRHKPLAAEADVVHVKSLLGQGTNM